MIQYDARQVIAEDESNNEDSSNSLSQLNNIDDNIDENVQGVVEKLR
jgi:hypothetical protein